MKVITKYDVGEKVFLAWQERRHNSAPYYGIMFGPLTIKHIRAEAVWQQELDTKTDKPTGEVKQTHLKIVYEFVESDKSAQEVNCFATTKEAGDFNLEKLATLNAPS